MQLLLQEEPQLGSLLAYSAPTGSGTRVRSPSICVEEERDSDGGGHSGGSV